MLQWLALAALVALPSLVEGSYYRYPRHHRLHLRHRRRRAEHPRRLCRAVLARPCRPDGDGRLHDRAAHQGARARSRSLRRPGPAYLARHGRRHRSWRPYSARLLALPALRVRGPYLAMVTIAFGWVIFKILQEWVSVTGGDLGIGSIPKVARRALDAADEPVLLRGAGAVRARARVPVPARALAASGCACAR